MAIVRIPLVSVRMAAGWQNGVEGVISAVLALDRIRYPRERNHQRDGQKATETLHKSLWYTMEVERATERVSFEGFLDDFGATKKKKCLPIVH